MSDSNPEPIDPNPVRGFLLLRGIIIPIPRDRKFILGREKKTCDIALPDQRVSKQHILIHCREQKYTIADMDSMNGTYLNGEKVTGTFTLMPGDQIKVTPFSMLFIGPDQIQTKETAMNKEDQSHFSGQLETLKVIDLVQLINSTGQSGLLNLRDSKNKSAKASFLRGEIVSAEYGSLHGNQAVFAILGLSEGDFDFVRGEQTMPTNPIEKKTQALLFEGCQLKDENRIPGTTSEPRESNRKSTQPLFMPADLSN